MSVVAHTETLEEGQYACGMLPPAILDRCQHREATYIDRTDHRPGVLEAITEGTRDSRVADITHTLTHSEGVSGGNADMLSTTSLTPRRVSSGVVHWVTRTRTRHVHGCAPSVNEAEVAHFSRLSAQWWDEHGEFALLHRMNPIRAQFVRDKLSEVVCEEQGEEVARAMVHRRDALRGLDVLDVGCGGGLLAEVGRCFSLNVSLGKDEVLFFILFLELDTDGSADARHRCLRGQHPHRVHACEQRPAVVRLVGTLISLV